MLTHPRQPPPKVPITDGRRERSSKGESYGNHEDARSKTV
jgi:hypothetical protein